jgi:hypothetical protein
MARVALLTMSDGRDHHLAAPGDAMFARLSRFGANHIHVVPRRPSRGAAGRAHLPGHQLRTARRNGRAAAATWPGPSGGTGGRLAKGRKHPA